VRCHLYPEGEAARGQVSRIVDTMATQKSASDS
jgi:hypothetical protein